MGLPRVEEIFEKRRPKNPAVVATATGVITEVKDMGKEKLIRLLPELDEKSKGKNKGKGKGSHCQISLFLYFLIRLLKQ
jgi:hypothetical protein